MYRLWIKDQIEEDIWHLADLGNDMPAMNYQSNNIAELKNRNQDYSQALKLPITENNSKIFGFVNEFDVVTQVPYQKHICRLESDDCTIAGKGSFLILDRLSEYFECQILSGNADLFTKLNDSNMKELELGYFDWTSNTPNTQSYFRFVAATFNKNGNPNLNLDKKHLYPFVYVLPVIRQMLKAHNFSFEHNLGTTIDNKAVSIASLKMGQDSLQNFEAECIFSDRSSDNGAFEVETDMAGCISIEPKQPSRFIFHPTFSGSVKFKSTTEKYVYNGPVRTSIIITNKSTQLSKNYTLEIPSLGYEKEHISDEIVFNSGDEIVYSTSPNVDVRLKVKIIDIQSNTNTVPYGGRVYIADNLGFTKQSDFFKMFVQCFGLTIRVDSIDRKVYAYTMDKVYENKVKAKDWSQKLHKSKLGIRSFYISNYAQENTIAFNENKDDDITDIASFTIQNETLKPSKELFKIELEAGKDNMIVCNYIDSNADQEIKDYLQMANIPLEDTDGNFQGGKPHMVTISLDKTVYDANNISVVGLAKSVKAQSLINEYYKKLTNNLLNRAIVLEEEFLLSDQDIAEFDQFIPVYIEHFGAYFYVNKIQNYISSKLTKCELIRL